LFYLQSVQPAAASVAQLKERGGGGNGNGDEDEGRKRRDLRYEGEGGYQTGFSPCTPT